MSFHESCMEICCIKNDSHKCIYMRSYCSHSVTLNCNGKNWLCSATWSKSGEWCVITHLYLLLIIWHHRHCVHVYMYRVWVCSGLAFCHMKRIKKIEVVKWWISHILICVVMDVDMFLARASLSPMLGAKSSCPMYEAPKNYYAIAPVCQICFSFLRQVSKAYAKYSFVGWQCQSIYKLWVEHRVQSDGALDSGDKLGGHSSNVDHVLRTVMICNLEILHNLDIRTHWQSELAYTKMDHLSIAGQFPMINLQTHSGTSTKYSYRP